MAVVTLYHRRMANVRHTFAEYGPIFLSSALQCHNGPVNKPQFSSFISFFNTFLVNHAGDTGVSNFLLWHCTGEGGKAKSMFLPPHLFWVCCQGERVWKAKQNRSERVETAAGGRNPFFLDPFLFGLFFTRRSGMRLEVCSFQVRIELLHQQVQNQLLSRDH